MWLINTKTLELHYFLDAENAPKHAILLHCWGEEDVTHKDFRKKRNLTGAGCQKIKDCCEYARKFGGACYDSRTGWEARVGLEWVWVDTVCIDKRSSTELSEAINSMYLWYHSADICIAYLEDVNAGEAGSGTDLEGMLGKSRWFTRGWTLQELVAPTVVYFVDATWKCFGWKRATIWIWPVFEQPPSLNREIEAISGIPAPILDKTGKPPSTVLRSA